MELEMIDSFLKSNSLRHVLSSKELAQLGDFLVNFIYTAVRIGLKGVSGSIHVWDYSLKTAMELANLRKDLAKKMKPDRVADAAEALIAYSYLTKLMDLPEMIEFLSRRLNAEDFEIDKMEKEACAVAFSELFEQIMYLAHQENRFHD